MEKVLFLTHTQTDGLLSKAALEVLGAAAALARELGSSLMVGLVGEEVRAAANQIAGCGASQFLGVTGADFASSRYSSDAAAAEALVRSAGASLVLAPATSRLDRALPGVAQRLQGRVDTHVTGILREGEKVFIQRWYYRQRLVATATRSLRPWFILVDAGVLPPWQGESGTTAVEEVEVPMPVTCQRTRILGVEAAGVDARTIRPEAPLLLVAGAGWAKKQPDGKVHVQEAETLIREFLSLTPASLGSSKSLVDQAGEGQQVLSLVSHLNQVGQTGSTPRHPKGLATCCHGEEPHVVGWQFITERRAVNLDPHCGWAHGKADVVYVADAFAVMARVNQLLAEPR